MASYEFFNSIRPLLSSAQPFDLCEHMVVVHEADGSSYNSFLISYFKMSHRVIMGIFNSFPICGHLNRSETHTQAQAQAPLQRLHDVRIPVCGNGQRYFANILCPGAMELVNHSINMAGSSGPN